MPYWELIGLVEACAAAGWWGIFAFHGVDQGHLPIAADCLQSAYDLCTLLDHLARNKERVWVGTVVEVAEYVGAGTWD